MHTHLPWSSQLGGIKLHKHFSWFHTAKWGVHRIAPRTVLHVIRIVLTMELQPLKTVELHGWVCLPDSLVRNGSTSPIHTDYKRTHAHTHTHTRTHMHTPHTHTQVTHTHTHTHTYICKVYFKNMLIPIYFFCANPGICHHISCSHINTF